MKKKKGVGERGCDERGKLREEPERKENKGVQLRQQDMGGNGRGLGRKDYRIP